MKKIISDEKEYNFTDHQYYTEFLLVPCWVHNSPCDICKIFKLEVKEKE